ncbi:MAG: phosphate ABC transporter substrate-binding protein PstS [Rhodoplanes sp.]
MTPAPWRFSTLVMVLAALIGSPITGSAQGTQPIASVSIRGAGSTLAAPLWKKWVEEYAVAHHNVSVGYDAVGSGEGVKRFIAREVDFAASDEILTGSEAAKLGDAALMLPVTAGMIALAYNIPGVNTEIRLPRDVYVDIFAGVIKRWDDPRIKAANPGLGFPRRDIALVARQDSSGTTAAFTKHLAAISPAWRAAGMGVGKVIEWPKGTMLAPGNEGVAGRIRVSEGSIGYVEYRFAQRLGLRMAALENKSGSYITPTTYSGDLALSARVPEVKQLDASVLDPTAAGAYPITTYSWMFLYPHYADPAKGKAIRGFVEWVLSPQAQNYGAQLGYLPLTGDITALGKDALAGLAY